MFDFNVKFETILRSVVRAFARTNVMTLQYCLQQNTCFEHIQPKILKFLLKLFIAFEKTTNQCTAQLTIDHLGGFQHTHWKRVNKYNKMNMKSVLLNQQSQSGIVYVIMQTCTHVTDVFLSMRHVTISSFSVFLYRDILIEVKPWN